MNTPYIPIDCSFHDKLLEIATFKKEVLIQFVNDSGTKMESLGTIVDVYTKRKEEFLVTNSELIIRLDRLIQVGDIVPPADNFCAT